MDSILPAQQGCYGGQTAPKYGGQTRAKQGGQFNPKSGGQTHRNFHNSSAWHNIHHSDVNANFGEVSSIWDKVCKTSKEAILQKKQKAASF